MNFVVLTFIHISKTKPMNTKKIIKIIPLSTLPKKPQISTHTTFYQWTAKIKLASSVITLFTDKLWLQIVVGNL